MRTGEDFLNEKETSGVLLVRLHHTDNPSMNVTFYGGLNGLAAINQHKFWPSTKYKAGPYEAGHKFANDNMVQFECFKSVENDPKAFCPGCLVENHTGTRPNKLYYGAVLTDDETEPRILEMMPTIGNGLSTYIKNEFMAENAMDEFPKAIFRVTAVKGNPYYTIDITRKTIELEEVPEVPDIAEFLRTMRITRSMEDVLNQLQLENLWNETIETDATLAGIEVSEPTEEAA